MKQLTNQDIEQMAAGEFNPDIRAVNKSVRAQLRLGQLMPAPAADTPDHAILDLHQKTEEQAWAEIINLAHSGTRAANIITGASGILKIKFQQWARDSTLAPKIIEFHPINNGSFFVRFRKNKKS